MLSSLTLADAVSYSNIASGIGTLISAAGIYYAYRALKEVQLQRESTYKPEIVISGGSFNIYNYKTGKIPATKGFPLEYTYEKRADKYEVEEPHLIPLPLLIHNIGLGAAKDIQISFSTQIGNWQMIITELSEQIDGEKPFIFSSIENENRAILSFTPAPYLEMRKRFFHKQDKLKISHILPTSTNEPAELFHLPDYLLFFISSILYLQSYIPRHTFIAKPSISHELPPFKIKMTYLDIANKQIEKNYIGKIIIRLRSSTLSSLSKGELTIEEIH